MTLHKVGWYVEGRVVLVYTDEVVTLEDITQINREVIQHFDTGTRQVHLIVDVSEANVVPVNLVKLRQHSPALGHMMIGWMIVVTTNKTIYYLAQAVPQMLTRCKSHVVESFDEAVAFLAREDPTIDWDETNESIRLPAAEK